MSRSLWKPIFVSKDVQKAIFDRKHKKNNVVKIFSRSSTIVPSMIGLNVKVYNGVRFIDLLIKKDMVGHKFGEFAATRKKPTHKKKAAVTSKK
jgi:small subunit ribosomal protein S19